MLEEWSTGIMDSGKPGQWFIGKNILARELINEKFPSL
jgi:hypothetical protein